jgi:serine/threonine protein kinase
LASILNVLTVEYVTGRYVAPEVLRNEEYDTKVDVFSFALILQEVNLAI